MKLALVSYMSRDDGQIPIGLLTLAEIARKEGVNEIRILDLPHRRDEDEFIRTVRGCDLVGFSSICSTYHQTIRLCRKLKDNSHGTRIVLGGPQASLTAPASLDAFPFVDVIFQGEAEHSWRDFLRNLKKPASSLAEVPGILWRDAEEVRQNTPAPVVDNLGTLPFPAFDLYDFSRRQTVTPIEIGRGCPFACSFCSSSLFFRRNFRLKPVARILEEMDRLYELHDSRTFYFVQDSFSNSRTFVEEMCEALRRHARPYIWYCSARTDQMSAELAARMKESGCRGIYFGLETGSQRIQQAINKRLNVEQALKVIRSTAEQGLEVTTSMIIGFPQETPEDLRETLRVFLDLKGEGHPLVQLHVLAPLPGSILWQEGHGIGYDAMPSDFSDTAQLDREDRALIERHPDIFPNFRHFVNPTVPRKRFLFLAHLLSLASMYFPNTLCLAARESREELLARLLDGSMPPPFHSDPAVLSDRERWVTLTGELLEGFVESIPHGKALDHALQYDLAYSRAEVSRTSAMTLIHLPVTVGLRPGRRIFDSLDTGGEPEPYVVQKPEKTVEVFRIDRETCAAIERFISENEGKTGESTLADNDSNDLAKIIDDLCASCGECCFEAGGILCGADEWPAIRSALAKGGSKETAATAVEGSELLLVPEQQTIENAQTIRSGRARTRRACPALRCLDGRWRCSIEGIKPAGCIAYPLKLVLGKPTETVETSISFDFEEPGNRETCPLEKALRRSPRLLDRYRENLSRKLTNHAGAVALAAYNSSRRRAS